MDFNLNSAITVLERMPQVLATLLNGLSEDWTHHNEGDNTWSPYDVIGHLIHGEKTDWIIRMEMILSDHKDKTFAPFDRFAQFEASQGKSLSELLTTFENLRRENLAYLKAKNLKPEDLRKTGVHPAFGTVTLQQLLATWVAHDMGHIAQISRVMAKQYQNEVGPWRVYLPVLNR